MANYLYTLARSQDGVGEKVQELIKQINGPDAAVKERLRFVINPSFMECLFILALAIVTRQTIVCKYVAANFKEPRVFETDLPLLSRKAAEAAFDHCCWPILSHVLKLGLLSKEKDASLLEKLKSTVETMGNDIYDGGDLREQLRLATVPVKEWTVEDVKTWVHNQAFADPNTIATNFSSSGVDGLVLVGVAVNKIIDLCVSSTLRDQAILNEALTEIREKNGLVDRSHEELKRIIEEQKRQTEELNGLKRKLEEVVAEQQRVNARRTE